MKHLIYLASLFISVVASSSKGQNADETQCDLSSGMKSSKFSYRALRLPVPPPGSGLEKEKKPGPGNKHPFNVECGPHVGSCAEGLCCSVHGYCGTGPIYCSSPDCLFEYGSGCDANKVPAGEDTSGVPREQIGKAPYGFTPIYNCVAPNTIALTYDDGPNRYTSDLLDILDSYNAKATFFVTGINSAKGEIDNWNYPWASLVSRMYNSGHQVASHTWSHQNLDHISSHHRKGQMVKNEMAIRNILGGFPTYMRPPYSACTASSGCLEDMKTLGYHVSYYNLDTNDYNNATPEMIQHSKDTFDQFVALHEGSGRPLLVIAHDVHKQTVYNLTTHMLRRIEKSNYRFVTLGECLEDPPTNWYRWPNGIDSDRGKQVPLDSACGFNYTCRQSESKTCCDFKSYSGDGDGSDVGSESFETEYGDEVEDGKEEENKEDGGNKNVQDG